MNNMIEIISSDYYKEMYDLKIIKWYFKRLLSCDCIISNSKNGSNKNQVQSRESKSWIAVFPVILNYKYILWILLQTIRYQSMHFIDSSYTIWAPRGPKLPNNRLGLNTKIEETKFRIVRVIFFYRSFSQTLVVNTALNSNRSQASLQKLSFLFHDPCSKSDGLYNPGSFPPPFSTSYSSLFCISCKRVFS